MLSEDSFLRRSLTFWVILVLIWPWDLPQIVEFSKACQKIQTLPSYLYGQGFLISKFLLFPLHQADNSILIGTK